MVNGLLLLVDLWLLGGLTLLLHRFSPRLGFAPLIVFIGALTVLIQGQLGVYVEPFAGFIMFISSNVLVPVVVMAVLILYVAEGSVSARMTIIGVLSISLFVVAIRLMYRVHLSLPGGGSFFDLPVDVLAPALNVRVVAASLVAFTADMFVIAIFYQGLRNGFAHLPDWIAVGLALIASLWTDALVFSLISDLGTPDFLAVLPGDVLGKTVSALALWPLTAFYLGRVAPRLPGYIGVQRRRTFDVLSGSLDEIKLALVRAEAALEQSEAERRKEAAYFQQIANHINEALWLSAVNQTHAFYVNPAYERIWGRSAASLYADPQSFLDSIHPEDRERVLAALPDQSRGKYDVEYRVVRPDGAVRWVRDRAFPIANEQGEVYRIAGITEDITERKQAETHRLELAVEREKVKMLRDFVSEVTHDLKNPLTTFGLKIGLLKTTTDPDKRHRHLEELGQQAARMGKMIDDMLTIVRLERRGEATLSCVDVHRLLREICAEMQPLLEAKSISLTLDLAETALYLQADRDDLARALANLIDNGLHYTPAGGRLQIETQVVDDQFVAIRVSDSGIGIPPEDQPLIFDRFFRAANARAVDPGGTGLGLVIVKKIVEQHGGHIEVNSTIGAGTTFSMYFRYERGE
jgi:PAS domain S-box-containing protein